MTDTPDLDALARQYLDLWQEHLSDMANDGEMAEAIAKSIELMNGSAAAFAKMAQNTSNEPRDNSHDEGNTGNRIQSSGPTSTSPTSGAPDDLLDRLSLRIGELEKRIAELESASGDASK